MKEEQKQQQARDKEGEERELEAARELGRAQAKAGFLQTQLDELRAAPQPPARSKARQAPAPMPARFPVKVEGGATEVKRLLKQRLSLVSCRRPWLQSGWAISAFTGESVWMFAPVQ